MDIRAQKTAHTERSSLALKGGAYVVGKINPKHNSHLKALGNARIDSYPLAI
jgi:hypothetical protein